MLMAKNDVFSIEWEGLNEFISLLDDIEKETEPIIIEELTKFGMLAEEGAKALVHHDEGNLEDSLNFDRARKEGNAFVVYGGSNLPYALRRHEEPGRGIGTIGKPYWRGYRPGPKYLENAIKAIEEDYNKMNIRVLDRIMGLRK